jgi:oligopeptide transport system substrate-binding protein
VMMTVALATARRRTVLNVLLLVLVSICFACNTRPPSHAPRTFRINIGTEPPTLDWSRATDVVSFNVIGNLMAGLTELDSASEPAPMVAERWDVLDGGRRIVFHLRKDVLWTDGRKVRAQDFEFAWKRLLDPATASEYAYILFDVENAEAYNRGDNRDPDTVGVHAVDDQTLEVRLEAPAPYFLAITTFEATFPQRRDVVETYGSRWTEPENLVTNGPFKLASWKHESELHLAANENFFLGKPAIDEIAMVMVPERTTALAMYETGQLDFLDNRSIPILDRPRVLAMPGARTISQFSSYYYGFATAKAPFDDPRVRRAFGMAIDRKILARILQGSVEPTRSWIPPGMLGHNDQIGLGFDPAEARRLMAQAGYPGGKDFPEVTLAYNTDETHKIVAEVAQSMWQRNLGVVVRLDNQEWKVYLSKLNNDPSNIFRLGWVADYPDPETFMNLFTSTSGNNHTQWHNPRYDELVKQAGQETRPVERAALYEQGQLLLCERDAPILPLFNTVELTVLNPRFTGLRYTPMSRLILRDLRQGEQAIGSRQQGLVQVLSLD